MLKRVLLLLLSLMLITTLLVGCGGGTTEPETPEETPEATQPEAEETAAIKMAMVTDVGGVNDQSFNQSAWEGHQKARNELGVEVNYVESNQDADYLPNLEQLYDAGYDLIWGIGFMMGDVILEAAEQNPDQKYAIIDNAYGDTPSNLVGVLFKAEEASFLVGYIAGKMTETGKVGFVGGMDFPVIHGFHYGFMAGVKHANPDVEVLVQYAGDFNDAAIGKAIAIQMYQSGADIVFHAAGGTGDGVIEAAREQGKYAIGVDRDQNDLAPDNVITSAMKRVDNAIFNIAEELKAGNFPGGGTVVYGLEDGGVGIAPTSDKHVPADILEETRAIEQQIIRGEIFVPDNEADYNANY
ncbi:BMP family lipoprotein [Alkaliphilus peptidifermentans]|uniref:Basic membrane protein A n=1 Tax=Alkaliphilus peptidifermentans DSM 18978 TaxID=1120976 RepID=A0A1G5KTF4_9FIRM|nr:BMP family ABC transporter substrate-binding protein [Alkaliphilus peptidifermentans]SCZ03614.1 basic membrane protein A [Alkaliphilus peptidifermentans DSM 18978]